MNRKVLVPVIGYKTAHCLLPLTIHTLHHSTLDFVELVMQVDCSGPLEYLLSRLRTILSLISHMDFTNAELHLRNLCYTADQEFSDLCNLCLSLNQTAMIYDVYKVACDQCTRI